MFRQNLKSWLMRLAVLTLVIALAVPVNAMAFTGSMRISGSTTVQPVGDALAASFMRRHPAARVTVVGGGSGVGITDVMAGRVSIGMSARDLRSSEIQRGAVQTPIARDALTVIVHPTNPIRNLTRAQVTGIYTGRITNWRQLGGPNAAIVPVGRAATSGTFEFFRLRFLSGVNQSTRVRSLETNGLVRQAVAGNRFSIGYISMAFVNATIKPVSLDGVAATRANALAGRYGYVRRLHLVTRGRPAGMAKGYIDFALSPEGQRIVSRFYLPVR